MEVQSPAGIVFVETDGLTIRRTGSAGGWRYIDGEGKAIRDAAEIERLNRIALPPAYTEARFCPDPRGHIQAIGLDARGRRQYRYHSGFRSIQEQVKFSRCLEFGLALPRLRKKLRADLASSPTSRVTVISSVVSILDMAFIRIGNESYARANKSFGLTTLRNRHVKLGRSTVQLEFRGKGGIMRSVRLSDRTLARIVRRCQDLPGQKLFQYKENGTVHPVTSNDVNAYLREAMGTDFTAKHFRTWNASVIAFGALREGLPLKAMLERVSQALGNTQAIARKSYVHPLLIEEARSGALQGRKLPRATRFHSREERGLIEFLRDAASGCEA